MTTVLNELSACVEPDETFDRLAQLTAKAIGTSAAFVSLADPGEDEIAFAGLTGLPELVPGQRKLLSQTICRHVVAAGVSLAIGDTVADPLARDEPGLHELGLGAYLGVPLRRESGEVIGALCAVERFARPWSDADVEIAEGLATAVMTELELRASVAGARRQADERHAIVEAALDCVVTMDEHGLVREFNPAAERTFGYSREEALGRRLGDLIVPPEHRDAHEAGLRRYLATGEAAVLGKRIELTAMRADGSTFPVELSIARLEVGDEAMFVGFIRDLSELHAAEDRYRNLIEQMPLVTYMNSVDDAFDALYMSPQVEDLLGYSAAEWKASPELARNGIHPDDREHVAEIARIARAEGTPTRAEFRFVARDGRVVWVLDHTIPVHDTTGAIVCHQGFLVDITEQKQLEEQLRQSQKMEAVGQLAGGIAHDFNNMLTAISGYADLLASSFEPADPRADDVEQIRKAAGHAAVLTRQLLSFSRKQVLLPQRLDVNEVVRDLEPMLTRTIGGHVKLAIELGRAVVPVEADPDQLAQVVVNIALNGRDAMPDGGDLTIATGTVERESERFVAVEVTDTGSGMDEETRARVFEPFFTTKDKDKGTGLGLATAYGVVDQSGGRIEVESSPGAGTTFRVLLPAAA